MTQPQLFETTTTSIAGWNSHMMGLTQLLIARGPHRHRSAIPKAALEEFRFSAVRVDTLAYVSENINVTR